jgi:hypothetical protein
MSEHKKEKKTDKKENKKVETKISSGDYMRIVVREEDRKSWIKELYSVNLYTKEDLLVLYDIIKYQGFNRDRVLVQIMAISSHKKDIISLIIACALRGPKVTSKMQLIGGNSPEQLGIPASGGKGKDILTCNKIQAATADLAAYYLKMLDVPKRVISELPGWLQFPSAGSIKLPDDLRRLHIDFSRKFSPMIGGEFNDSIYSSMMSNSYLDTDLGLF